MGEGDEQGPAWGRVEWSLELGCAQTGGAEAAGRREEDRGLAGSARSE